MLDYQFGRGSSASLPRGDLEFFYSRRSGRLKQVDHKGMLFATIRPNGAIALSVDGAKTLSPSKAFLRNSVTVDDEAVSFVRQGKSLFCKFVARTGDHVLPGSEVVLLDRYGDVIAVGRAKIPGRFMREFNAGVAVKVRSAR